MSPSRPVETATPLTAILCMLGAGVCFACLDASAKHLVLTGVPAPFVTWVRFAMHVVLVLLVFRAWNNREAFTPRSLPKQALRAVMLLGSTLFNFEALKTLQLAETISIYFFGPMVITALAGPLLGEWAGWRRWMAIGIGLVGVLIITRPGFGTLGIGHLFIILSMLSYCFYVIMTRAMSATETPVSLIFYSGLGAALALSPAVPDNVPQSLDGLQILLLSSLAFYGMTGHLLVIRAYSMATTGALAPYPYMQMVWMIGFGYFFFGQLPDRWTIVGAGVIVASGLYILHRERQLRLAVSTPPDADAPELAKRL